MTPLATGGGRGLPTLPQAQIFVGNASGQAVARAVSGHATIDQNGVVTVGNLPTSAIISGVFDAARIPALPYAAVSHTHDAGAIDTGILNILRIPDIPTAKVTQPFDSLSVTNNSVLGAAGANAARLNVNAGPSQVGLKVRPNVTGSANAQDWEASNGTVVAFVTNGGNIGAQRFLSDVIQDVAGNSYWLLGGSGSNRTLTIGNAGLNQTMTLQTKAAGVLALQPSGGNTGVGTSSPSAKLHALLTDTGTTDTQNIFILGRTSSNTPAAGFTERFLFQTAVNPLGSGLRDAASIRVGLDNAADATRAWNLIFGVFYTTTELEALRFRSISGAIQKGWHGATPVSRSAGWAVTNPVTRKTFDPATVTHGELAQIVGTLISEVFLLDGYIAA